MTTFLFGLAFFLLLNLTAGLGRVIRGPVAVDRMVAAQLFGTTGVGILLILAEAMEEPALRDVGFIFALLAVVVSVAFVKRGWVRGGEGEGDEPPAEEGSR